MKESEFLAAIERSPGSLEAYSVYADWLTQHGDPRGELIALQLRATETPGNARLVGAQRRLLSEHGDSILGPCALLARSTATDQPPVLTLEWRYGFVRAARFDGAYDPERHDQLYGRIRREEFLRALMRSPCCRFLEEIEIADWWVARDRVFDVDLHELESAPPTLKRLAVVPRGQRDLAGRLYGLGGLLGAHPQLVELELGGESVDFPLGAEMLHLTRLSVHEHLPTFTTLAAIATTPWPALTHLAIISSGQHYPQFSNPFETILRGEHLPRLESLALRGVVHATWPMVSALARAPILWRLKELDLSRCEIDDFGAHALLQHHSAFAHLKGLNLEGNELSEDGVEAVRQLPCPVFVGAQRGIAFG